jgi:hypothetical protein
MKLSDEQLMAFADGDPSSEDSAIAEKVRSAFSAEENRALDDYRRTRDRVREAFAEEDREPLPAELIAMVLGQQDARSTPTVDRAPRGNEPSASTSSVIPLRRDKRPARSLSRIAMALAASIACAFVILSQWPVGNQQSEIATAFVVGPVAAGSALERTLERQVTGDPVALDRSNAGPQEHLMVAGTFRDRNARICREVELLDAALVPRIAAVACRASPAGIWNVEGTAVIARKDQGGATTFAPAGAPEKDALDALMSMLGAKATLSPEVERALIGNGWK